MNEEQIAMGKKIGDMIRDKGVMHAHVAKSLGIAKPTLSAIINGRQTFVSQKLLDRIYTYIYLVNTNDIDV